MRKRLLSILLLCCMVLTLLPTAALAEEAAPAFNLATDLAGITIPNDLVTCTCTKTNESRSYGQLPGGFSASVVTKEDGFWTVIIYVVNPIYKAEFDKDMGCEHKQDPKYSTDFINQIQFKLKYEENKWELLGEMPQNKTLHFTCTDKHTAQSPAPTIALVSRTYTDIKVTENSAWEYSIDNGATWQGSCHFTNLRPGTEYTIIARVKETATHQPSGNSAPLKISTIGSAITEDDFAELNIPANLVTVKCQTTGDSKAYGRIPGGFDLSNSTPYMENGVLKAIVQLNLPAYRDKYNADTKKTHEYAGGEGNPHAAFTLKYVNDKWELDGTFPNVVILVKCDGQHPQTPPYPTEENVSGLGDQIVAVLCNNVPAGQQSGKYYGLIGGGFTSTTPTLNADKVYESTITLIPSAYCNQFSGDTGIMHKVLSTQTTDGLKFVVKYDSAKKMWKPAEGVKQMAIWVTCDKHETPTPEMPMYPMADNISGLGDQIVAVLCNNVPTGQQSGKYYGLIGGGFTSTTPTLNADKVYESTITLIPSVYCNQFSGDTGIMHKVLSAQTTDGLKFVVKYDSSTKMWKPAEEVKQMAIWVTCDKHETDTPVPTEFTITFNGNDGTPSVGSMRTTNQKLTSLPTATRSGRYSFDGWYTAASGGTKITTATVFYENTTVYAHWTYIGGGGSSGGGGGYTYHTIRAISGLNGSISPSGWTSVRHGWDQTFTITPDKGYAVAKVLVDGKSVGSVKSYTFKNVTKDHTIEVVFMKANGNPQTGVFVDVPEGSYYEEAVDWAVEKGITTGTGNNYFTPDGICTRAQAVTFLWRVAGSPTPKTEAMVFEDVLDGSYYYEAVLWAVENGITVGTSATTFSPELTCSRAHIVTFLWRAANSPSVKMANPFTDVAADAYYIDAVLWAVKHKITVGTTLSTFSPDEGCTRAQIVTFLYRAHSK